MHSSFKRRFAEIQNISSEFTYIFANEIGLSFMTSASIAATYSDMVEGVCYMLSKWRVYEKEEEK